MKKFKEFVSESPMLNSYFNKNRFREFSKEHKSKVESGKHEHLHGDYYVHHGKELTTYFRKHEGKVKEYSSVTPEHVHKLTDKGADGDVKHIHNFMIHHSEKHGKISTDDQNTEGSKHLWKSLIKSKPANKTFHVKDHKTGEEHEVDHSNIDNHENSIWSKKHDHMNVSLEMRHHKK